MMEERQPPEGAESSPTYSDMEEDTEDSPRLDTPATNMTTRNTPTTNKAKCNTPTKKKVTRDTPTNNTATCDMASDDTQNSEERDVDNTPLKGTNNSAQPCDQPMSMMLHIPDPSTDWSCGNDVSSTKPHQMMNDSSSPRAREPGSGRIGSASSDRHPSHVPSPAPPSPAPLETAFLKDVRLILLNKLSVCLNPNMGALVYNWKVIASEHGISNNAIF